MTQKLTFTEIEDILTIDAVSIEKVRSWYLRPNTQSADCSDHPDYRITSVEYTFGGEEYELLEHLLPVLNALLDEMGIEISPDSDEELFYKIKNFICLAEYYPHGDHGLPQM